MDTDNDNIENLENDKNKSDEGKIDTGEIDAKENDSGKKDTGDFDASKFVSIEEFNDTKAALKKANREAADNRHKLKAFSDLGMSVEDIQAIVDERNKKEEARKRQEGKFEELMSENSSKFQKMLDEKDKMVEAVQKRLETFMIDKELSTALAKEGVSEKIASPLIRPLIETYSEEGDDNISVVIRDTDGTIRMNDKGQYMTISEYVTSLKEDEDFAALFPAPSKKGVGSKESDSNASGAWSGPSRRSEMNNAQRLEYQKRFGFEAYQKLPF